VLADTHAHIDFGDFDHDRDEVVRRAEEAGVNRILIPGVDAASSRKAADLAERYVTVYAAAGIHPNETAAARPDDMAAVRELLARDRVVAVGETGLDFYRDRAPRDVQLRMFREHLDLARETGLPVIVHFRDVGEEGIEMTGPERFEGVRGVFHCFGGSARFMETLVRMGFFIGFDGPLTYPKSDRVEVARVVPLDRALFETDSPFLAPQGRRGARNEPSFVAQIAEAFARVRGMTIEEATDASWRNAVELFGFGA
jgi:TatD DNase family protein